MDGLLRSFDHLMKLVVHVKTAVFDWSEEKCSRNYNFLVYTKKSLQKHTMDELHEKWDLPESSGKGETTTQGNTVRRILHENSHVIVDFFEDEKWKNVFRRYTTHLSIMLRVISSSKNVNVERYKVFCQDLYVFLIESFPRIINKHLSRPIWISMTPTDHRVLGHSWELIELNGGVGLGSLDEAGMEGCHKLLRNKRTRLSRKIRQQANLIDTHGECG